LRFEGVVLREGGALEEVGGVVDGEAAVVFTAFCVVEEVLWEMLLVGVWQWD
jgi:hypothetical protein